jgi:hypothetical protein
MDEENNHSRIRVLIRGSRSSYCETKEELFQHTVDAILDYGIDLPFSRPAKTVLEFFAQAMDRRRFAIAFEHREPTPLRSVWQMTYRRPEVLLDGSEVKNSPKSEVEKRCMQVGQIAERQADVSADEWASSLSPWNEVVEPTRDFFGERWILYRMANVAAGIVSSSEKAESCTDLLDQSQPLCGRARFARLRSNNPSWWQTQFEGLLNPLQRRFVTLLFATWAGPNLLLKKVDFLDENIKMLDSGDWSLFGNALSESIELVHPLSDREIGFDVSELPSHLCERTIATLGMRATSRTSSALLDRFLAKYTGADHIVSEFVQRVAMRRALSDPRYWQDNIGLITRTYANGVVSDRYSPYRFARAAQNRLPLDLARQILERAEQFPNDLVNVAEAHWRMHVAESIVPVGDIAERDKWFS